MEASRPRGCYFDANHLPLPKDHVHGLMEAECSDGCGLIQRDNEAIYKATMGEGWFKESNSFKVGLRDQHNIMQLLIISR